MPDSWQMDSRPFAILSKLTTVQKFLARTMQSVLSSNAGSLVTRDCLCHSFPLLCAAPPSIPSHPAVVFAPARALLASCPAPPASPCRAAPPPGPPATAPTWTLTPWSADSSLLDCQVIAEISSEVINRWNY